MLLNDPKKVVIVSPFWRCGSTLLSARISKHYQLKNLDEIYCKEHPINQIDFNNFNKEWYESAHEEYLRNSNLDVSYQLSEKKLIYDWNNMFDEQERFVFKVHGIEIPAFDRHYMSKTVTNNFILLYRKDLASSLLSLAVAMDINRYHGGQQENFLSVHKTSKEHKIDIDTKNINYYFKMIEILYQHLLLPSIQCTNNFLSKHNQIKIHNVLEYNDLFDLPETKSHIKPYTKNTSYQRILDKIKSKFPINLNFENNKFFIENSL